MPYAKSMPPNEWLAPPPEGKPRIVISPAASGATVRRNEEDAGWARRKTAVAVFRRVARCKNGVVLFCGASDTIQDLKVEEISGRYGHAPARLGDFFTASRGVLKIVALDDEACVDELGRAVAEDVGNLMIASSNLDLLDKVQNRLDGVVTGLWLELGDEEQVGGLAHLLGRAGGVPFVLAPPYLASHDALRHCKQRLIVHASLPLAIRAAFATRGVEAVVTPRREFALEVREGEDR